MTDVCYALTQCFETETCNQTIEVNWTIWVQWSDRRVGLRPILTVSGKLFECSAEVKLPAALDVNSKQTVTEHQAESTLQHAADAAVCTLHCASICLVHSLHSLRSISHGDRQLSKFIHLIAGYFSIRHYEKYLVYRCQKPTNSWLSPYLLPQTAT